MLTEIILSDNLSIDNGTVTLKLLPHDAAVLAKACLIARESVPEIANEQLAVAFSAFAGLFKAAAIAANCHGWMPDEYRERAGQQVERLMVG